MRMFKLLCVCLFVAKYANGLEAIDDEELKRRMLSYFEQSSSWVIGSEPQLFDPTITIIQPTKIERTYISEIRVQQASHPYLFSIMQMLPIKAQIPFAYVYEKLFKYFIALDSFKPSLPMDHETITRILEFVFPELGDSVIQEIAEHPLGPEMLKALFEVTFARMPKQDINLIFGNCQTTREVIVNFILYLCPSIKEHFLWKEDSPINAKLNLILELLFPGINISKMFNLEKDFQMNIYNFLESLFKGKLIPNNPDQQVKLEGPEWLAFQKVLHQYNIDVKQIPKDVLFFLYFNYKLPQFQEYLPQIKEKYHEDKPIQMDAHTLGIWQRYLFDLKIRAKTLNDMPSEVKEFLKQHNNPKELIKIISNTLGYEVDASKLDIPLDPKIMELWKKFIFDILNHKGDTTHLPKPLLEYFYSLSKNPNYKDHLAIIFDSLSINPKIANKWNTFFDQLQEGQTTLDQMPKDLTTFLTHHEHPEEFLRLILKLKDSKINTLFLNFDTKPEMMKLWKKYIEDVAENKGNLRNIPPELLQYFYQIASNPAYVEYIKLLFAPDRINPKTLNIWNDFIGKLKLYQVDLKDMPTELIQLMLKYKSPDEFFKVLLPQHNVTAIPNETVREQWKNWTSHLQDHNGSVYDTPKELKDYFYQVSPSKDYQTTLSQIYAINPDILKKWKAFMDLARWHAGSLQTMPDDLKANILGMKSPKEFVNLIFKGMEHPLNDPIPEPSEGEMIHWGNFLDDLKVKLPKGAYDNIRLYAQLMNYIRRASNNENYRHEVNSIFQIDFSIVLEFEKLSVKMQEDYNVSISSLPMDVVEYLVNKFDVPFEGFTSILTGYPGEQELKTKDRVGYEPFVDWFMVFGPLQYDIPNYQKVLWKSITKGSVLEPQIDQTFKLHESNRLISKTEKLWKKTKEESKVHDGVEVFIQFLEELGKMYAKSEELCEERPRIVEALEKVKNGFASRSNCTYIHV